MFYGYPKNAANNIYLSNPEETFLEIFIKLKLHGIAAKLFFFKKENYLSVT